MRIAPNAVGAVVGGVLALLVAALGALPWLVPDYSLSFMLTVMSYLVLTVS